MLKQLEILNKIEALDSDIQRAKKLEANENEVDFIMDMLIEHGGPDEDVSGTIDPKTDFNGSDGSIF